MILLERTFIGDGVYVRIDDQKIILTTEIDGLAGPIICNQVVLEHEIFHNLLAVIRAARERQEAGQCQDTKPKKTD